MADISVWITTYNHELFIEEAIESVLKQQTSYAYEIVIGEDCSTDRTREIIMNYKNKYPDKIRLFLPEKNLGIIPMAKASYSLCAGKYIAWLDGDDYWIDPLKLQKQVDFLEANPNCSFCFHRVRLLDQIKNISIDSNDPIYKGADDMFSVEHFIQVYNPIGAVSVVHRSIQLPSWLFDLPFFDLGMYFVLCKHGKGKYMKEIMGVYRIHKGGAHSGNNNHYNFSQIIIFFKKIRETQRNEHTNSINKVISIYNFKLFKDDLKHFNFIGAISKIFLLFLDFVR